MISFTFKCDNIEPFINKDDDTNTRLPVTVRMPKYPSTKSLELDKSFTLKTNETASIGLVCKDTNTGRVVDQVQTRYVYGPGKIRYPSGIVPFRKDECKFKVTRGKDMIASVQNEIEEFVKDANQKAKDIKRYYSTGEKIVVVDT